MTTVEYIRELYQEAKAEHGEDDPWTLRLKRQLDSANRNEGEVDSEPLPSGEPGQGRRGRIETRAIDGRDLRLSWSLQGI